MLKYIQYTAPRLQSLRPKIQPKAYMDLNLICTIIFAEAKAFEELNVFRYFEDQSDFSRPPPDLDLDFTGLLPDDEPEDCLCIII